MQLHVFVGIAVKIVAGIYCVLIYQWCLRFGGCTTRGLAVFKDGVPEPPGTLRMVWGSGVRVAMSTISPTECFWFTTKTCPKVS